MDSTIDIAKNLLEEGQKFNFSNFCYPNEEYPGTFCGEDAPGWLAWKTRTLNVVKELSSENSPALRLAIEGYEVQTRGDYPAAFERSKLNLLKSLEILISALQEDVFGELRIVESKNSSPVLSNRVFVVHGHDSGLKTDVERFLLEIGLQPVVLHRQVDSGSTIIEKFEKHSDVGYAFILLTPDEIAYTIDQDALEDSKRIKEYRARPNVIFEFGYFVGRLGRSRVCCLHKGEVIVPSDLSGLVYKKIDGSVETQAYSIIRELKAAGYEIRM